MKDEVAISGIHKVANEDPNHLEAIKEIRNSEEFLFYDLVSQLWFTVFSTHSN